VTNNEYSSSLKYRGNNQIKLGGEKMTNEYHTLSEYLQKFNKKNRRDKGNIDTVEKHLYNWIISLRGDD
jgi:hypothetical protein